MLKENNEMVDRVANWDKFAAEMHDYIEKFTLSKYGTTENKVDLMTFTEPRVCVWNILKYAFRLWNGKGKKYDVYKIAHYAEMAWTIANGDLKQIGIAEDQSKTG